MISPRRAAAEVGAAVPDTSAFADEDVRAVFGEELRRLTDGMGDLERRAAFESLWLRICGSVAGTCVEASRLAEAFLPSWRFSFGDVVDGRGREHGHAWLERGGEIWDPTSAQFAPPVLYPALDDSSGYHWRRQEAPGAVARPYPSSGSSRADAPTESLEGVP